MSATNFQTHYCNKSALLVLFFVNALSGTGKKGVGPDMLLISQPVVRLTATGTEAPKLPGSLHLGNEPKRPFRARPKEPHPVKRGSTPPMLTVMSSGPDDEWPTSQAGPLSQS
jgi:hypothetical protein